MPSLSRIQQPAIDTSAQYMGLKNRIINGAMMIDQRNAGASVTPATSAYTIDRWEIDTALASKFTIQRVADAPAGFLNSVKVTVASSFTPAAGNWEFFRQSIEGLNTYDLGWGTAGAQAISVSFWVKASVTGTYSVAIGNSANNYSYITTYTVAAANTWQQVVLLIPGPTAGSWQTDNTVGLRLKFDLGAGSNYNGTAGTWQAADVGRTSSSVVLGSNAGATWQITGVQLEKGSTATSFDYRPYGTELQLCQRYYYRWTSPGAGSILCTFSAYSSSGAWGKILDLPVTMRATPTTTASGTFLAYPANGSGGVAFSATTPAQSTQFCISTGGFSGSSGLVAGNSSVCIANTTSTYVDASAEL